MLIVMKQDATKDQIEGACAAIRSAGFTPNEIPGATRTAIGITGNQAPIDPQLFRNLPGVSDCVPVSKPYKLVSREVKPDSTIVDVAGVKVGDGSLCLMAGPCSVESYDQVMKCAQAVAASGARIFRGGAFKPRTSPYLFQGLKEEGLRLLEQVRDRFGLKIVTEAKDTESLPAVAQAADLIQIGARNMQNFSLVEAAARTGKPILLKRGMSATLQEWLMAAEYILSSGNYNVILCERGIRTFETMTRNTLDLSAIVMIKHLSHLPVIADPSHGVGIDWAVPAMARAAVACGADGVMIETHPDPRRALSDGPQSLTLERYRELAEELRELSLWQTQRPGRR